MTTVDIVYRYATPPTEAQMFALGRAREIYGIRKINLDGQARTIRIEYDATRLTPSSVSQLLRGAGISIQDTVSLLAPSPVLEGEKGDFAPSK